MSSPDVGLLSHKYQQEVVAKLPPRAILPPNIIAQYPLGSDVSLVPETCGLLSPSQVAITNMDATALLHDLAAGILTAVEVTEAFGIRAAIAHQLVSCLTDIWLEEALVRAKELDDHLAHTGRPVGPLHGLPISLKDQLQVEGKITSLGFLTYHQDATPATSTAQLCEILQAAGAVFYVHTTLPQTIMHLECESFWGRTKNPFNTATSSGGSSGGEGALVAMRGSPLGVGTDIGGSVRSPAGNCGLYGLRPSAQRVPNRGSKTYIPGRDSIVGVVGPLAHSARDIELFMQVVTGASAMPWKAEPALLELPWRDGGRSGGWERGERKLRVGVMWNDGEVRPVKPIKRGLENAVGNLRKSGEVELVDFMPYEARKGWELIRQLYFPDAGRAIHGLLDKSDVREPLHPLTTWLLEEAGPPLEDITDQHCLWELNSKREAFRSAHAAHWNAAGIDVLLCPVAPQPASPHGEAKWWTYTSMFNLVDYPCIAFPTGLFVDVALDSASEGPYQPLSLEDRQLHDIYDPKKYANAPISLQLVARKYHDEELLDALMKLGKIIGAP